MFPPHALIMHSQPLASPVGGRPFKTFFLEKGETFSRPPPDRMYVRTYVCPCVYAVYAAISLSVLLSHASANLRGSQNSWVGQYFSFVAASKTLP